MLKTKLTKLPDELEKQFSSEIQVLRDFYFQKLNTEEEKWKRM